MGLLPALATGYIAIIALPLTLIDIREHRLPNPMTISAIAIAAVSILVDAIWQQRTSQLILAALIALATWSAGYLMARFELIGMGDIKLLTAMHLLLGYLSPWLILISLTAGFTLASLVSLVLLAMRRITLKSSTAMGPFLLIGFFAALGLEITAAA